MNNTFSDLITRLRNGQMARRLEIDILKTKSAIVFLNILLQEGYIRGYRFDKAKQNTIVVLLKYFKEKPAIIKIKQISCSSIRVYANLNDLRYFLKKKMGCFIISTTKGLMTDKTALSHNLGGEVFIYIE